MSPSATKASYAPGSWVAIATGRAWLLVDLAPEHELVERCWAMLSADVSADEILDVLISEGIRRTPSFALVTVSPAERRVIVRGTATVSISRDGHEDVVVSAADRGVWEDQLLEDSVDVLLLESGEPLSSSVELPMSSGVTRAGTIRIGIAEPAVDSVSADGPPAPLVKQSPVAPAGPVPEPAEPPDPIQTEPVPSYDHLFGATQRPVLPASSDEPVVATQGQTATVPVDETVGWLTLPPDHALAAGPTRKSSAPSTIPVPPVPIPTSEPGLIDGLPWLVDGAATAPLQPGAATSPSIPALQPSAPIDVSPSEVARTVDRSALLAVGAQADPPILGPTVLAGYCPNGHLSAPHGARCRVCGVAMAQQQGFEIARPPLGVLRLSTGDVVTLDRGVLLGRAPEAASGDEQRPHVLRLASPENDISRNHAEVVLDGWHVYVRDLGSTNGTVVTLPGQSPTRLRANDLQLLEHGTAVTLADEVTITFEVTG